MNIFAFDDSDGHTHYINMNHVIHVGFYPKGSRNNDQSIRDRDELSIQIAPEKTELLKDRFKDKDARRLNDELKNWLRTKGAVRGPA